MVREIIHVQIGQCGNQVGMSFWNGMIIEHKLNTDGSINIPQNDRNSDVYLDKMDVYFNRTSRTRFTPRSIMVDLEPASLDVIRNSSIGGVFKPDNFIFGQDGCANNWAKGHFTDGVELAVEVLDVVRREVEACDSPQGFQITHSIGGGTGAGMGTLLLLKLRDEYPDRVLCTYSVFPSPRVSDVVVEPYNAVFSIHQLLENSDETFTIDNEALYGLSTKLGFASPTYFELNWLVSLVMSGVTASLRFPGKLNSDLRKMAVNLVPFPRLHFFLISQAPIMSPEQVSMVNLNIQEINSQMWSGNNVFTQLKTYEGKYLSVANIYRGENIMTSEVDEDIKRIQDEQLNSGGAVNWIPHNVKTSIVNVAPPETELSGTFVANSTSIKQTFKRLVSQFKKLYKRKAFLHWYRSEGMDFQEFQESNRNVRDLMAEYQQYQDVVVNEDNPYGEMIDDEE